jgi:regulator of telomere elongation helicase 1
MKGIDGCAYGKNREKGVKEMSWKPQDIEELHKQAQNHMFCPYYASKDRVGGADLIFMPYNYLIDDKIRENYEIDFSNSIIIFDEAHNVP